jgi:hypothetical protein
MIENEKYNLEKKVLKIDIKSVKEAQKESHKLGIANVYSKNRHLYFQLPNGEIIQEVPKEY